MTQPSTPLPGDPGDPAILLAPTGEAVDGRRLLAEAVGFGRALRRSGLQIDLASEIDFARALGIIDLGHRPTVREAGAAVFVRRRDDREVYDRVFDRYWRRRGRTLPMGPVRGRAPLRPRVPRLPLRSGPCGDAGRSSGG